MQQAFIDDLFDFNEDVSIRQKLDIIMSNRKALNFFQILFNNVEIVRPCQCKAGRE